MRADDRDDLIDAAAHAMTRGEPSAQLRTAIRARIERHQTPWPIWGKAAVACAAALLLIVFAGRGLRDQPDAPRPAPQIATVEPVSVPEPTGRARPERSERPDRPERRSARPIVIEPIVVPLMAVETSSEVMPIEIDDLQIEPLQIQ